MARTPKVMTPGELRAAKAVLKAELKTYVANVKAAEKATKEAASVKNDAIKAADKALAAATKARDAAVKAAEKDYAGVNKEQSKIIATATSAGAKVESKLMLLEGSVPAAPAAAAEPVADQAPKKRGRPRKVEA